MPDSASAPYANRGYVLNVIEAITLALAFALLGSRLYVRTRITKNLGWDDFFIVLAMITALIGLGMGIAAVYNGLGRHISTLTPEHTTQAIKWDFVQSLPLGLAAMFTKISIFIFLRRLFVTMHTRWTWSWTLHFVNAVNIAANLASATTVLTQCTPARKLWDPTVPGTCWLQKTQAAVGIFQGATSAFCDITFAFLPIVFLWNVHISRRVKAGICSLMGLGFFTSICAIIRTVLANTSSFDDFTYDDLAWNIWIDLETICGIIAACLPTIRPLLKTQFIKRYFSKYSWSVSSNRRYVAQVDTPHDLNGCGSSANLQDLQAKSWSPNTPHPGLPGISKTVEIDRSIRSIDQSSGRNDSIT